MNTLHDSNNRDDTQDPEHHKPPHTSPEYESSQNVTTNSGPRDGALDSDLWWIDKVLEVMIDTTRKGMRWQVAVDDVNVVSMMD